MTLRFLQRKKRTSNESLFLQPFVDGPSVSVSVSVSRLKNFEPEVSCFDFGLFQVNFNRLSTLLAEYNPAAMFFIGS